MGSGKFFFAFGGVIAAIIIAALAFNMAFRSTGVRDLNSDGQVNIVDMTIAAGAFGTSPGDTRWDSIADLNKDDKVDLLDLTLIAQSFAED